MKVSVIIPTYNRFQSLLHAIESVIAQTYKNIEIIIVNDCSTQEEYYTFPFTEKYPTCKIIHLEENSRTIYGYPCGGHVRNIGIKQSSGDYIAFLDDDDSWLPTKIEKQLIFMIKTNCNMSTTDGYIGGGAYNIYNKYQKYNAEYYLHELDRIYKEKGIFISLNGFPYIWNHTFIEIHNSIITSSVLVKKSLLEQINYMECLRNGEEDYTCWLKILQLTDCAYVDEPLIYYDAHHGK